MDKNQKKLEIGMSDSERYEILKCKTIDVPFFNAEKLKQIDENDYEALERIEKSGAFKIVRKIGEDFGVFKEGYTTQDVGLEFAFSRNTLHESIYRQKEQFQNYVKMMTILDAVVEKAIGIEVHNDRYDNPDSSVRDFYIFISAFTDTVEIVPVLLQVKTFLVDTRASLYVAVSLQEIKRSRIVGYTPDDNCIEPYPIPTSITISLSDLLSNVNVNDKNLLKYIPDGFLNDGQKEVKKQALIETQEYIEKKNKQRSAKIDGATSGEGLVSEPIIDYHADENTIVFIIRKKSANQTIHVAYALDDNYTEITCVSMVSLLHNTKNPVHFHVVESRLSDSNKDILSRLKEQYPHGEWTFHKVNRPDERIVSALSKHFTYETYFRLFLPDMFPHLEKIIYLDCDIIMDGDIAKLWNIDLGDKYLGAVPNPQKPWEDVKHYLSMSEENLYFNAGVMLLNLGRLREFGLFDKAAPIIQPLFKQFEENNLSWCADQEVLNHLLCNDYIPLPVKYNVKDFDCQPERGTISQWQEAIKKPVIIHYAGANKPYPLTKEVRVHPLWELYYKYKAMTPFADTRQDNKKIEDYHKFEAQMDNALILDADKYIQYKKHTLFAELAEKLPDMSKEKKLVLWGIGVDIGCIIVTLANQNISADVIVDGLQENHGKKVFHYTVQKPEILQNASDKYYVLLCMRNEKPAAAVMRVLDEYGYDNGTYHHIYSPLWDIINNNADIESLEKSALTSQLTQFK